MSAHVSTPSYAHAITPDFSEIPVLDIGGISTLEGQQALAGPLFDAARNVGFFYIRNHGIPAPVAAAAFAASRSFFELPESQKARIAVDRNQRGWMAAGMANLEGARTHDAKEVFFWGLDLPPDDPDIGQPMVAPNQWPDDFCPGLKPALLPYYQAVLEVSRGLLGALAIWLGQRPDFFAEAYRKPLGRGQLVYYPAINSADIEAERFSAAPHADFGVLTILMQDDLGGLQVQNSLGEWIEATPIPGTLVCNIGDLLERWTNGKLTSTRHRVINRSGRSRFSIPVFCDPASTTMIDPRDFDPDADIAAFPPVTAGEYIAGKNRKNFSQYK